MASFHNFYSCTILANLIYHAKFLLHLGRFHRCNLGKFTWWTQVQTGSQGFYLPHSPEKLSECQHENTYFVFSKKSLKFSFFSYFVLKWYLLVLNFVKTLIKWMHFFLFLFSVGIKMFKVIETTSHFSNTSIFTNTASLVLIFYQRLHITSRTYYNLTIKEEKYKLDWSTSLMQWNWLFFESIKMFQSNITQKNKTKTKN